MSIVYTNKVAACKTNDSSEMILEFFMDEPILDTVHLDSNKTHTVTSSVAKVVMSKDCMKGLYRLIENLLADDDGQG